MAENFKNKIYTPIVRTPDTTPTSIKSTQLWHQWIFTFYKDLWTFDVWW